VLPTDRVKFDMQVDILRTYARLSGGRRPVNSEQIAKAINVSTNTASLSNGFFVECGWLDRVGRGQYVATEATVQYNRRMEFAGTPSAVNLLADTIMSSWFWLTLEPALREGRLSRTEALVLLSTEANTSPEHRPQLENVLQWLQFLGLIQVEGDYVLARTSAASSGDVGETVGAEPEGEIDLNAKTGPGADKTDDRRASAARAGNSGDVVIAFSTDLRLTSEDLKALSPEQITALFAAVGTVAALTNRQ